MSGARLVRELAERATGSEIVYQYSPESFTGTELDYAVEICNAVTDVWEPTPEKQDHHQSPEPRSRWRHRTSTRIRSNGSAAT